MKRPINELDILKAFAIILVIIGHITIKFTPDSHPDDNTQLAQFITFGIYLFHMPLFMTISGAIYQLSKCKPTYQHFTPFITNKLKRIIIPYYIIGLCALLPVIVYITPGTKWSEPSIWFKILLAEDCRHLWYLLALFWIFILQFISDHLRINLYALFIFSSVLTLSISALFPDFNFLCIHMAFRKWPCFILGMIIVQDAEKFTLRKSITLSVLGGIACAAITVVSKNYYVDMVFSFLMPYFICAALITMARHITCPKKMKTIIQEIAGYSFGLYLFHVMVILLMYHWLNQYLDMWMLMAAMFIVSIAVSIGITALLRKIHCGFAIGE